MLKKIQTINTLACGRAQSVLFDGYANGDIVFTEVVTCESLVSFYDVCVVAQALVS